jgi:hypothetical protein
VASAYEARLWRGEQSRVRVVRGGNERARGGDVSVVVEEGGARRQVGQVTLARATRSTGTPLCSRFSGSLALQCFCLLGDTLCRHVSSYTLRKIRNFAQGERHSPDATVFPWLGWRQRAKEQKSKAGAVTHQLMFQLTISIGLLLTRCFGKSVAGSKGND